MNSSATSLFVAMPTATGSVRVETLSSIVRMTNALDGHGIRITFSSLSYAELPVSRNALVADFLDTGHSHLLFIDDDMAFEPQVIGDMLSVERPFVGVFGPHRHLDLERFARAYGEAEAGGATDPLDVALAAANGFVGAPVRPARHRVVEAERVGTGLLLLRRDVFQTLDTADGAIPDVLHPRTGKSIRGYFERIYLEGQGTYLPEDDSLCHRWRRHANGRIFAFAARGITRYGEFAYRAALSDL